MRIVKEIAEWLDDTVSAMVNHAEAVKVKTRTQDVNGEQVTVFEVWTDPDDCGLVIGKSGHTIDAIRLLVSKQAWQYKLLTRVEVMKKEDGAEVRA